MAPAKLNLFLRIVGRRSDGYHLLETVFQLINLNDFLHFELRTDHHIHRKTNILGLAAEDDLVIRAAKVLQQAVWNKTGNILGANISIEKRIPMGGGLGGGSSDAATTMIALNNLWQGHLSRKELMVLGLRLGADIPFFLFGYNAFAEGIGEKLRRIDTPSLWFIVIDPGINISTRLVFSSLELTKNTKSVKIGCVSKSSKTAEKNDLEKVAVEYYPEVKRAISWLSRYGDARMTGSGACVFCSFTLELVADTVLELVPSQWKAWKVKSIREHPLKVD